MPRLRHASCGHGWGTADQLGDPPKVLRSCGEQHLIPNTAQAPQPKPVELQNALHVREPHLDFLALAARLLEGLRVGESTNMVPHILVDIARDSRRAA